MSGKMFRCRRKEPHDIITLDNGRKLLVLNNKPHSREYKRLMKEEAKRWKEYFDDFLTAMGDPNPALAIEAVEKKWGIKL